MVVRFLLYTFISLAVLDGPSIESVDMATKIIQKVLDEVSYFQINLLLDYYALMRLIFNFVFKFSVFCTLYYRNSAFLLALYCHY